MSTELVDPVRLARISAEPLSVDTVLAAVTDPGCGGIGLFVGTVRDIDPVSIGLSTDRDPIGAEDRVVALHYTCHPSAEQTLAEICREVAGRHQVRHVAVEHRIGDLGVGDLAVVVATSAVHRGPALEACRDLIDTVKEQVPIWKEQIWDNGSSQWSGAQ